MRCREGKLACAYSRLIFKTLSYFLKAHKRLIVASGFLCTCLIVGFCISPDSQVSVPDWVNIEEYPPYEPELHEDFPTGSEFEPRIPHILHQAHKDHYVPLEYASNIKSFLNYNSDWKYHFWTEESARQLIGRRHRPLLGTYDAYSRHAAKSEILRYVVLYEFGGVFADIGIKCLRPLKRLTFKYACILTTVPFEIHAITFKMPYVLYHDLIFCKAKHPFLKQIIDNLPLYQPMLNKPSATGPLFLSAQFNIYNHQKYYHTPLHRENKTEGNSPFFYCSRLPEIHEDAVYVPNSKYFSFDLSWLNALCRDFKKLSFIQRRGCLELKGRTNAVSNLTFTFSHWYMPFYTPVTNFIFRIAISNVAGDRINN
ncbi:uncharacterized protein LOC132721417 [Ruditapes philippinarum]|uniref:uncharacterized protein LOC132721417 n=1 Tax=Ruditapes philippinarum TaxID=129788 RepID=UPI00295AADD9|nr:uncharacterized protein LOC132721417 [Ruditapes philippinarum]XP_060561716.1 uncharacterized protein LOC132721417 [Ruditapes philippinarum]